MRSVFMLFLLALCASGCYKFSSGEEGDMRTVPVTNNPNLVPQKREGSVPAAIPY